ncbi:polysaccharide deacetylase family protein [Candidatus Bathyarchaeota archaeon]|nr:polysaccharide deacetylase family protein [Candidatus Bathyarchaeota archaeon]
MSSIRLRIIVVSMIILVILTMSYVFIFFGVFSFSPQPTLGGTWDPQLGWDFEDHTYSHPYLTTLSADQIRLELEKVNVAFIAHGYPTPKHFDYPYGDSNSYVESIVAQYRSSGKLGWGGHNYYPVSNWYKINVFEIRRTLSWETIRGWVDTSVVDQTLLVINTHDVSSDQTAYQYPYGCTPEMLMQLLDYLVQKQNAGQLTVMTMAQAYDNWSTANQHPKSTVVITFADCQETDYSAAYPLFKERGLKGSSYLQLNLIDQPGRISWDEIAKMRAGL